MASLRECIYEVLEVERPMTVRQVFYQLVTRGVIEKTEKEYKQTVVRLLTNMRLERVIPFDWIADNTRWMRKPRTYGSLHSALEITRQSYRRQLWANQESYVEVYLEKDALAGVVYDVTSEYDVPLMVTRGFSSISFLYESAELIQVEDRPTFLYQIGDHDPAGRDIVRATKRRLKEFAPSAEIHFERIAVTPEQIEEWSLPTRPTKRTDSRSRKFKGDSVEVDAIPTDTLRALVRQHIEAHLDPRLLAETERIEAEERATLDQFLEDSEI